MYRCVVIRSLCPASSWIARAGAPRIARCEQNVDGHSRPLRATDILVVSPYNMQVRLLAARLPAPIVFFSMASSSGEDVPRELEFLFSRNAFFSSRIEGTFTTPEQLVLLEAGVPDAQDARAAADTREVLNYVRAMEHGLERLKAIPVSLRLVREIHAVLLDGVRGGEDRPGEFSTVQNYIWHEWVSFFLRGVAECALEGQKLTDSLLELRDRYHGLIRSARSSALVGSLIDDLFRVPSITIGRAAQLLHVTHATASSNLRKLQGLGIVAEVTGRTRGQVFVAREILEFLGPRPQTAGKVGEGRANSVWP